jgi:membrane-bound serine protease (ClpP class)
MKNFFRIAILVLIINTCLIATTVQAKAPSVVVLAVKGIINPVTADYIINGINNAEKNNAQACVIELDTPGGLDTSMRDIIQAILDSSVPVVVYVAPPGARAASAGTYITIAAHIAAMSPDTAIGAASPVALTASGVQNVPTTEETKTVNDAAAYIRSLAESRGRNADWAEQAVRQAVSATENEALSLNVIDLIAPDLQSLLSQINGSIVTLNDGTKVQINTTGANFNRIDMTVIERFLLAISDPNIAYVLLGLASLGLFVEIANPGLIFPGVVGAISLIFALFALGNLPVNFAGVILIILAFILFMVEAFTPASFGALTAGGIACLVVGGLILYKGGPLFKVNPWVIAIVAIFVGGLLAVIIFRVVKAQHLHPATGSEGLEGEKAVVREALELEGTVFVRGELWNAVSDEGKIGPGEPVIIKKIDGLKLHVIKVKKES